MRKPEIKIYKTLYIYVKPTYISQYVKTRKIILELHKKNILKVCENDIHKQVSTNFILI